MQGCRINEDRARLTAGLLASLKKSWFYEVELEDPQLKAVRDLKEKCERDCLYRLVIASSLTAYRLKTKGEEYWESISRSYKKGEDPYDFLTKYLSENRELARSSKLKRLMKLKEADKAISFRFDAYEKNLYALYEDLLKSFGGKYQKTFALACKMFHYALIAQGTHREVPMEVPIPLDSRIMKLTATLGLVEKGSSKRCFLEAWRKVSEESGVDQLHIDAFLWIKLYPKLKELKLL